ncbi:HNH endonuclease [Georgenia alba]|uniref:HNH endonuclease n=1 Tax=Georgenia alba TaxID=2233858 RepID=A0ABW2Q9Z4_9MICO
MSTATELTEETELTEKLVRQVRTRLAEGRLPTEPGALVGLIGELEQLKATASAVQADASVHLDGARREEERIAGVPARRRGRGVATEIALARRESTHRGRNLLAFARILRADLPHTSARLRDGTLSEWRAMLLARETVCLEVDQRRAVDKQVCADAAKLDGVGTRRLVALARSAAIAIKQEPLVQRAARCAAERRVSIRPAPESMCYVTALLPLGQGVAAYAALTRDAEAIRRDGDARGSGQLMADLFVARTTGLPLLGDGHDGESADHPADTGSASDPGPPAVPVTVNVTMSDAALLGGADEAAVVTAAGVPTQVVPAQVARLLLSEALSESAGAWVRRLYTDPAGRLVAMSSKQRCFDGALADVLLQRDQGICRMPYCDAPIRHLDHVVPREVDGPTSEANGQGLCEACNHAKQAPGWRQRTDRDPPEGRHSVLTRTPSGRTYRSQAPPPPGRPGTRAPGLSAARGRGSSARARPARSR